MIQMEEICKTVPYFNRVYKNILDIRINSLRKAYDAVKNADCVIFTGEGRSELAFYIGIKGLLDKLIYTLEHANFAWPTLQEAAPFLEKKHQKIVILASSGSGETLTPVSVISEIVEYIKHTGTKKFTIIAVGSNPNSSIGKKIKEVDGIFVKLKGVKKRPGRKRKENGNEMRLNKGIMADVYELGSLLLFLKLKQAVNQNKGAEWILEEVKTLMENIGKIVDKYVETEHYGHLIEEIMGHDKIVVAGLGQGNSVAKITAMRLGHLKRRVDGEVYSSISPPPGPLPSHVLFMLSYSGQRKPLIGWADIYHEMTKKMPLSIIGSTSSNLSDKTESFVIDGYNRDEFYAIVTFILSAVIIGVYSSLRKRGIDIPENIMKALGHSRIE